MMEQKLTTEPDSVLVNRVRGYISTNQPNNITIFLGREAGILYPYTLTNAKP